MAEKTYLIQGESGGCIKIGKTRQTIQKRIKGNQTGNPDNLILLGTTDIPEASVHAAFASIRVRGEWFSDTDKLRFWARANCELTPEGEKWSRGKVRVQINRQVTKDQFVAWYGGQPIEQDSYQLIEIFDNLDFNDDIDNCSPEIDEDFCEECFQCVGTNIPHIIQECKAVLNVGFDYENELLLLEFDAFTSRKKLHEFWEIVEGVKYISLETIARVWIARGHQIDLRISLPSFTDDSIARKIDEARFVFADYHKSKFGCQ